MAAPTHGRAGVPDQRGSNKARKQRKLWLLGAVWDFRPGIGWAPFGGDGKTVLCVHCSVKLTYETVEADRIIPGALGGSYERPNIQPSCSLCNKRRGDNPHWRGPKPRRFRRIKVR